MKLLIYYYFLHSRLLPGSTSPDGYSRQQVLLLHLIFLFVVIFSYKCNSTLKVVVVAVVVLQKSVLIPRQVCVGARPCFTPAHVGLKETESLTLY